MSKSRFYPNKLIVDEYTIKHDKDTDGHKYAVNHILDPDYDKDAFDILDHNSCCMLKNNDRWNNYFWLSADCYFCNNSSLL